MRTNEECIQIINDAARHCGVSAKDVSNKLLAECDKEDLRKAFISKQDLINAIIVWRENGQHNNVVPGI